MTPRLFVGARSPFRALLQLSRRRRQCVAAAVYGVETLLLWDCIKHHTQQSWLLWIIQSSVVALMKAILHSPRAFIFPAQTQSPPFSATSSLLCPPFLSPTPPCLSLISPLLSLPPSSPPHLPPALPPPTLLSNPGQQVYKVVLSVPPAAIPGGQSGKQTQPVPAAWLTERQRERQRRRRRRIIKMRGQKGFRMLRADEGRGRLGKEKKKKWRENERL